MLTMLYVYLSTFFQDEEGQGMAEYGLILVLVALAVITAMGLLGKGVSGIFDDVVTALTPPV